MIFWMIAAALTVTFLGSYVHEASTDEGYNMAFFSKDISFGLTTALSVEGDVDIVYSVDPKFEIEVKNGIVTVKYDGFEKQANYVQNDNYKIEVVKEEGLITFRKREV